jgi:hypothetical protein
MRADPPYLYRPMMQVAGGGLFGAGCPGLGVPVSAPSPRIAAVFCERVGGSRTGREPGRRSRRLEGVLDAAARGARIMPAGGGTEGLGCSVIGAEDQEPVTVLCCYEEGFPDCSDPVR